MNRIACLLASAAAPLALSACANLNTAYRDFSVNDGSGAMVDIKQRAVIAATREKEIDGKVRKQLVVCAEPSPDALSAYAAELAAEGGNGEVAASLAAATQETAAFVGLRTQSIQLLRDSFYRACEGYLAGALTEAQFDILTRRHQRFMVALLGIEQLTGAVKAPAVTLTTEGQASAGQSIATLRTQMKGVQAEIDALKVERSPKDVIAKDATKPQAERDAAAARVAAIDKEVLALEQDKLALEKGIANARGLAAGGTTHAAVSNVGVMETRSDATLEKVAGTVGAIVTTVLNTDELTELCLTALATSPDDKKTPSLALFAPTSEEKDVTGQKEFLGVECTSLVRAMVDARSTEANHRTSLVNAMTAKLAANPNYTPEQVKAMVDAFTAALNALRTSS